MPLGEAMTDNSIKPTSNIENLHKQMIDLSLGDLLLVAGQAVNMKMDDKRLDLILKYVEIALAKRKIKRGEP